MNLELKLQTYDLKLQSDLLLSVFIQQKCLFEKKNSRKKFNNIGHRCFMFRSLQPCFKVICYEGYLLLTEFLEG